MKILKLELGKLITRKMIVSFFIFATAAFFLLQLGVNRYSREQEKKIQFVEVEQFKVNGYLNYSQYATIGFKRFIVPSPIVSYLSNATITGVESSIDTGPRLELSKQQGPFSLFKSSSFDYWFLFFYGGIVFASALGFLSFRNKKYLHFLQSFAKPLQVYFTLLLSRAILIFTCMILLQLFSVLQLALNNISIGKDVVYGLFYSSLPAFLTFLFFLLITAVIGLIKDLQKAYLTIALVGFLLIVCYPETVNLSVSEGTVTAYQYELKKLEAIVQHERNVLKQTEGFSKSEKFNWEKNFIPSFLKNVYPKMERIDDEIIRYAENNSNRIFFLSSLSPVTMFRTSINELSSMGYNAYLNLYRENQSFKKGFIDFCLKKKYLENSSKVVPFIKPDQYIYNSKSSLPRFFIFGLTLILFYIVGLFWLGYFLLLRSLYHVKIKGEVVEIVLDKDHTSFLAYNVGNFLGGILGHGPLKGKINLGFGKIEGYRYFPFPNNLPDGMPINLILDLGDIPPNPIYKGKTYGDLSLEEKESVLMLLDIKKNVFVIETGWVKGPSCKLIKHMDVLRKAGCNIISLIDPNLEN